MFRNLKADRPRPGNLSIFVSDLPPAGWADGMLRALARLVIGVVVSHLDWEPIGCCAGCFGSPDYHTDSALDGIAGASGGRRPTVRICWQWRHSSPEDPPLRELRSEAITAARQEYPNREASTQLVRKIDILLNLVGEGKRLKDVSYDTFLTSDVDYELEEHQIIQDPNHEIYQKVSLWGTPVKILRGGRVAGMPAVHRQSMHRLPNLRWLLLAGERMPVFGTLTLQCFMTH
ncbi:uncharacterized protein B0H18DRAFT_960246 [Fomitopsis serialis]|uniref:uncharacterized protein n=1 Tax=Fomitopsis serialis TaxID=139415 RepID=UPI0020079E2B|nr:uncharacterized protein B0H18DRAFT_960246 [Neoantrodia serialis]KAH9913592.1 hypothetical protein B0H18DRAFT_960246 [Neoantrodia serialis]